MYAVWHASVFHCVLGIRKNFSVVFSLCSQSLVVCPIQSLPLFHAMCPFGAEAVKAVSEVAQRIQDNARSHENHLQLRRVQKQLKGRKTRILTPG